MSDIIKIEHLNKCFGDVKAVNDLSFRVKKGELFAFLGVNGAGKSTTISIICGQLRKDSGNVWIKDKEADRAGSETKRLLGVVFQDSVLDKPLTVKENLKSRAALYGITGNAFEKRLAELVEQYQTETIVLGYPKNLDGSEGDRCVKTKDFCERVKRRFPKAEVLLWDERFSTIAAERSLREVGLNHNQRKSVIDKMAAVHILQGYLDSKARG